MFKVVLTSFVQRKLNKSKKTLKSQINMELILINIYDILDTRPWLNINPGGKKK